MTTQRNGAEDTTPDETFAYVVVVRAKSRARADRVIAELTGRDEAIVAALRLGSTSSHASARELGDAAGRAELLARSAVALGRPR